MDIDSFQIKYCNRDWLYEQYVVQGKKMKQIAHEINVSTSTIKKNIKKFDIPTRNSSEIFINNKEALIFLNNRDWLYEQYVINERTLTDIAHQFNITRSTISGYLKKFDITIRSSALNRIKNKEALIFLDNKDWLYEQYIVHKKPYSVIGSELNISSTIVLNYIKKFDIKIRNKTEIFTRNPELSIFLQDKKWLYEQYIIKGKSTTTIAIELNISRTSITKYLKKHNIDIRLYTQYNDITSSMHKYGLIPILEKYQIKHITSHTINLKEEENRIYEIDEFLPDHNIFLELYGVYWHNLPDRKISDVKKQNLIKKYYPNMKYMIIYDNQILNGEADEIIKNM